MDVEVELQAGIKILKQQRYTLKAENVEQAKRITELETKYKDTQQLRQKSAKMIITIVGLKEQIAGLEKQLRWIPVSERLPELLSSPPNASSKSVWLIFKGEPQMGYYTNFDGWRIYGIRFQKRLNQKDITHWMPIILP